MGRDLIVFGNGLGRALDNDFFDLKSAMKSVWESTDCLDPDEKSLISNCLNEGRDCPLSEDDLEDAYHALVFCKRLGEYEASSSNGVSFLSGHGKRFEKILGAYVTLVASYFHTCEEELDAGFVEPFVKHLKETKSHVATLNYDTLLYKPLIQHGVVDGYDGALVDGLCDTGFKEENLQRKFGRRFGWYLHLHGSPRFRTESGKIIKVGISDFNMERSFGGCPIASSHVVLSHVDHKLNFIEQSKLLSVYWEYLEKALDEVDRIIVFGYSGADKHLNSIVGKKAKERGVPILVVKRDGEKTQEAEDEFWKSIFCWQEVEVNLLDNILQYVDWQEGGVVPLDIL